MIDQLRPFLLALCLALPVAGSAQMVAKTITFAGATQSQAELLALTGLTPGKAVTKNELDAAANRLDASGLFASVQYRIDAGVLTFVLEPFARAQLQQVHYVNFPWYTQAELTAAVHARLSLFTGSVSPDGDLKDQVARTLQAILKQRGVDATVESQGVAGGRMDYRISSPAVTVTDLQIENIQWDSDPVLRSVRAALVNTDYADPISQQSVRENLGYALQEIGFLDESVAVVGHAEPRVEASRISVVMTGSATPGGQYKVGRVTLPAPLGTVTAHELESGEQQIKPGGLPSPSLVKNTVGRMTFLFQSHGFLDATASVEKAQDPAAHTVSFSFSVAPGEVYHMRDVVFAPDLTTDQKTQLTQTWKLPKGGVYEGAAVARSLASQRTMCGGRPPSFRLLPDHAAHQVDVSLSCQAQRQSR